MDWRTAPEEWVTLARELERENAHLRRDNARLEAALEDLRQTVGGYLHGADWKHWQQCHASRFHSPANAQEQTTARTAPAQKPEA